MSTDKRVTEDLMETLEDGEDGFEHAAAQLADSDRPELAVKLREFSRQRDRFSDELERLAAQYGDDVDDDGSVAAAVHRAWMTLKDAITGSDPDAVLAAAVQGEEHAISEYEKALSEDISDGLRAVVQRQLGEIQGVKRSLEAMQSADG